MIGKWVHLCIDMQRMFSEDTRWHVPWMREVSPLIEELSGRHPENTIFKSLTQKELNRHSTLRACG